MVKPFRFYNPDNPSYSRNQTTQYRRSPLGARRFTNNTRQQSRAHSTNRQTLLNDPQLELGITRLHDELDGLIRLTFPFRDCCNRQSWSRFPDSVDKKPPIWLIYYDKIIHESRIGHTIAIIAVSAVTGIDYTNLM